MVANRETIEKKKYEKCWKSGNYKSGPGHFHVEEVFDYFDMMKGESLNDYGCGDGVAARMFHDKGLKVLGIDITKAGLTENIPFIRAPLWNLPKMINTSDYGFCCDVLEHLPTDKVDKSLEGIFKYTRYSAFFRISHARDNNGGRIIGEPLHLTVKDYEWWEDKISDFFGIEESQLFGNYSVWYVNA